MDSDDAKLTEHESDDIKDIDSPANNGEETEMEKEPIENDECSRGSEVSSTSEHRMLTLRPIDQLLNPCAITKTTNSKTMQTIDLLSDGDDDAVIVLSPSSSTSTKSSDDAGPSKSLANNVHSKRTATKSNKSHSARSPTTSSSSSSTLSSSTRVTIKLKRLPHNLQPLLRRHNLKEIVNDKQEVISTVSGTNTSYTNDNEKLKENETRLKEATKQKLLSSDDEDDFVPLKKLAIKVAGTSSTSKSTAKSTKTTAVAATTSSKSSQPKTNGKGQSRRTTAKEAAAASSDESETGKSSLSSERNDKQKSSGNSSRSNMRPTRKRVQKTVLVDSDSNDSNDSNKEDSLEPAEESNKSDVETAAAAHDSNDSAKGEEEGEDEADDNKRDNDADSDASANGKKVAKSKSKKQAKVDDSDSDFAVHKRRKVTKRTKRSSDSESMKNNSSDESNAGKQKKKKRRRIKRNKSDEANSSGDDEDGSPSKGRKKIRKIIKARDLEDDTKRAAREETERKKRIEERQKLYNQLYDDTDKPEEAKQLDKLILDFDEETKEELISVDKKLVLKLKPHQGNGVKFMWDTCFESIKRIDSNSGSGCILAHCMGLGKTLQVVTLVHTLLSHRDETKVEKILVICPLSTVLNWVNEFKMWLKQCARNRKIGIYEISKYKQNCERVYQISEWHDEGGVLIMGYDMFRNLSSETKKLKKREKEIIQKALVDPGADLIVCDEGHLLKNSKTSLSKAVNRIKSLRRIVLTGTPLQNNLNEYYCMVQFVKPNLLGKYNEYLNRFVNPITNGQYVDSTPGDILMMKRRSHILHKMLDGCVQRRDYAVLAPYLPIKHEYVVYIKLTKLQVELYNYYMANKPNLEPGRTQRTSQLFSDFQSLQRIWTHPRVLRYSSDKFEIAAQKKRDEMSDDESEGSIKDFIDNSDNSESEKTTASESGSDTNDDVLSIHSDDSANKTKSAKSKSTEKATPVARRTRANRDDFDEDLVPPPKEVKFDNPTEWWMTMCPPEELDVLTHSGKLMLLFSLLDECDQIGDKLLVFSQSLYSLDVIEHFLSKVDECTQQSRREQSDNDEEDVAHRENSKRLGGYSGSWSLGLDYYRLDGSTSIENRNIACQAFNRETNTRGRLFLISTRAGGLGINLVAANRVVIFDVSWNPSHDIQSIFRVYRFGQKKPCYIYRFIAMGTMEEKIYERQVTKLAISKRVIDEHQIDRHYKQNDLMELYKTNLEPTEEKPIAKLPKDRLFATQLKKFDDIIFKYHEHDSLLENKAEETLDPEEIKAAWEEFEAEKTRPQFTYVPQPKMHGMGPTTSKMIFGFRSDVLLKLLNLWARRNHPTATDQQVRDLVPMLLQQLYERMQIGDASMLHSLVQLQVELEAPIYPYGQHMIGQQQQQQQQLQHQQPNMMMQQYAAAAAMAQNPSMQQQNMIAAAQNRLMGIGPSPSMAQNLGGPSNTAHLANTIIEID